jgi:hypothetical protein
MPNIYDIENIKIIQKHKDKTSPLKISQKVTDIKKSKIQSKIETIVHKNTQ